MITLYKVLGQLAPLAGASSTLYTAPATAQTVCSTLAVCNRSATPTTFRVAVVRAGGSVQNETYIVYDAPIEGNDSTFLTLGITLNSSDTIRVQVGLANVSFNLFGSEITNQ